jgi:hypothetical protein
MASTELPIPTRPVHGILPSDLLGGTNRVRVDDRGEGNFVRFTAVDGDAIGGVIVEFSGSVTCAFQNDGSLSLAGRATVPVTPWKKVEGSDTGVRTKNDVEWICFYPEGNTAGRVGVRGYIAYAFAGASFVTGAVPLGTQDPIAYGKQCVASSLLLQGGDIRALETEVPTEVPSPRIPSVEFGAVETPDLEGAPLQLPSPTDFGAVCSGPSVSLNIAPVLKASVSKKR